MELKDPGSNVLRYPRAMNEVADGLTPTQADLMSAALRQAADDTGAAMAHQLSEPLTVLQLYLHDLRRRCDLAETDPETFRVLVDMALRATERTCEILEIAGRNVLAPLEVGAAVARGWEAIDLWKRNGVAATGAPAAPICKHPLTAREREVLTLVIAGGSNKSGGQTLGISTRTFEAHRAHLMRKVGARNTADLIRISLNGAR